MPGIESPLAVRIKIVGVGPHTEVASQPARLNELGGLFLDSRRPRIARPRSGPVSKHYAVLPNLYGF